MFKKLITLCLLLFLCTPCFAQNEDLPSAEPKKLPQEKNPWFAALFSALIPGTGQMYVEEDFWPQILITGGVILAVGSFFFVDHQRAQSVHGRDINGDSIITGNENLPDAHWEALTLILQIGVPTLWIWNFGDAYQRAEEHNKKVIYNLDSKQNTYIMKERLLRLTLWRF